jgi:WD40 repeat protein
MLPSLALAVAFTLPQPAAVKYDRLGDPLPPGALARFGTTRFSSPSPTGPIALSPDGKRAAYRCGDEEVVLLDIATGHESGRLVTEHHVVAYAFLTDDVLAVSTGSRVLLWQPGGEPKAFDPAAVPPGQAVAVSPDGTRWAVGGGEGVRVYSHPACEPVGLSATDVSVQLLTFSPDGKWLLGGIGNHVVRAWDAATGKRVRTWAASMTVHAVTFTPDSKGFFVAGSQGVEKYALTDDAPDAAFTPDRTPNLTCRDVRVSADGKTLRLLTDDPERNVIVMDPADGKVLATHKAPEEVGLTEWDRLHADDTTVLGNRGGHPWRWDAATGVGPPVRPLKALRQSAFAADGKTVRTLEDGERRHTWEAATGEPTGELFEVADAESWDKSLERYAVRAGTAVAVHEAGTGRQVARLEVGLQEDESPRLLPDGLVRVSRSNRGEVWDIARGKPLFAWTGVFNEDPVVSADRRAVALLGSTPEGVSVWEVATGKLRAVSPVRACYFMSADPDGKHLWVTTDHTTRALVRVEIATGKVVRTLPMTAWATRLAVSPDGARVAVFEARDDTGVAVYDAVSGHQTHHFAARGHTPLHVAFSPDGRRLASSGFEGVAYVWDLARPVPVGLPADPAPAFRTAAEAAAGLRHDDAELAHRAAEWLREHPADGVAALAAAFPPAVPVPADRVEQLLRARDDRNFKTRLKAHTELAKLGPRAAEALKAELERPRSEEVRAAAADLLAALDAMTLSGERLAEVRAVEAAERMGTPQAAELMEKWATGAATATLTTEATAAVGRLKGR